MSTSEFNINVDREYNLLNECKYIRNKDRCVHDSNVGFEARFDQGINGFTDTAGMDYFMATGHFLWGVSTDTECYISLAEPLSYTFEADFFSEFEVDLLVSSGTSNLTGRVMWKMETDSSWDTTDAAMDFEVEADGIWHRYKVNLLEKPKWVGNCKDIRFYPFIDGEEGIDFIIQRIAFKSDYHYKCNFPPCAYERSYKHPCQGIGTYARAYSTSRRTRVSIDDDNSRIGVSIDGYPAKYIDLDLNHCTDCWSTAQDITLKLNTLSFGGYKYAECVYDPIDQNFSIHTGTRGSGGSVTIYHGGDKDATAELGFTVSGTGARSWRYEAGLDAADGFESAYQKLPSTILYRLPSSNVSTLIYDPKQPLVEIGRSDLKSLPSETVFEESVIEGFLQLDIWGAATYEGYINTLQFKGEIISNKSKILLLRPTSDTAYKIIYMTSIASSDLKKGQETLYEKAVEWYLRAGDIFGLYMCKPVMHREDNAKLKPEMLYKYSWLEMREPNVVVGDTLSFTTSNMKFYGYQSLPVYGYSTKTNPGYGIDAELRYEYGVSHVALVGDTAVDRIEIDLMELDSTQVRMSSTDGAGALQSATDLDLAVNYDSSTTEAFWVEFWFPGNAKTISTIKTYFEDAANLRSFCWEMYITDAVQYGITAWDKDFDYPTEAKQYGTELGWLRIYNPSMVIVDDYLDATGSLYLGANYVTADPNDYYPENLDEATVESRFLDSEGVYWNTLEQTFYPISTTGLKLYCWRWNSSKITGVEIKSIVEDVQTLLHSVEAYGWSGPEVFSTEKYNVIDLEGQIIVSSNISRAETTDYKYGLDFALDADDSDLALSPVGTTLSRFEIDITGLPARLKQIKIIPQKLAVRVHTGVENEPITEIKDMSWGMPADGSEFTYGPTKEYKVCNDTGHRANLILGVMDPLAINQACVFYSDLDSLNSLSDPYRGLKADLVASEDLQICNHKGINYHARAYTVLDVDPDDWYSTSNSGTVWQTLVSGSPFTDTTKWNEPYDPNNDSWKIYNWAKAEEITVDSGTLNVSMLSRPVNVQRYQWLNPTYFQDVDKESTFYIETKVPAGTQQVSAVDVSAGLVIFDNQDTTNYIRIERYSGNGLSTASGMVYDDMEHLDVAFNDYVRYGNQADYTGVSGVMPSLRVVNMADYPVVFRLAKNATSVDLSYRLPWDSWTTASSCSIAGWSNDLRIGVFGGAQAVSRDSANQFCAVSFDYVSYKASTDRHTEPFDYYFDFSELDNTDDQWTAYNADTTTQFTTSPYNIRIKRHIGSEGYNLFTPVLNCPALVTEWGSTKDYCDVWFRLNNYSETVLASGIFSAGVLIRDTSAETTNYVKFGLRNTNVLELTITGTTHLQEIDPITTASGIYLNVQKGADTLVFSYGYHEGIYTVMSGISIGSWSADDPIELVFGTDFEDVTFSDVYMGSSTFGATHLAMGFDTPVPVLDIYGRGYEWSNIQYSATATGISDAVFSSTKPDLATYVKFEKSRDYTIDRDLVKVIPDPRLAVSYGYEIQQLEIPDYNQQLYDYTGNVQPAGGVITSSGAGWSDNLIYKGLPQYDFPVIALDLGKPFELGRCPLAMNAAKGRFSTTETDYLIHVVWPTDTYEESGFKRKCQFSINNECTASIDWGKPKMAYEAGEGVPTYYYAGVCDGWSTSAGDVRKACPLYSSAPARWLFLESTNYITTTASAGAIWFIGPIELSNIQRPLAITDNVNWWSTDYGLVHWTDNTSVDPDYTVVYTYPGFNLEGSISFNVLGCPYWRFSTDYEWTHEDGFSVDLRFSNPENINSVEVKIGRDPDCYWSFSVTGTLTSSWEMHSWKYKDAEIVINREVGLDEPIYTTHDPEYYDLPNTPYRPLPYVNHGYTEVTVSGGGASDVFIKNFKNTRTRFVDDYLYLGLNESLYISDLDLKSQGTIQLDYYPSEAAVNIIEGDPRTFMYSVFTIGNANTGMSLVLDQRWGWTVYCFSPEEKKIVDMLTTLGVAEQVVPSVSNPGPFHLVFSWSSEFIGGTTNNIMLWVDGHLVCNDIFSSMENHFKTDDIRVVLGKGATVFDYEDDDPFATYARFKNLRIYKQSIDRPNVDLDSELLIPENLIELSLDGSDWKSFIGGELPIIYPGVEHGDCTTFYMRNKRPRRDVKDLHTRHTAYLSAMWEVSQ
jgi:hypothetical protein